MEGSGRKGRQGEGRAGRGRRDPAPCLRPLKAQAWAGWSAALEAEAGLSASIPSMFSQESRDSPEEMGRETLRPSARDAEKDIEKRRDWETPKERDRETERGRNIEKETHTHKDRDTENRDTKSDKD